MKDENMVNSDIVYVHFGRDEFDLNKFEKVKNNMYYPYKPVIGGFWASPENSECNWENTFNLADIQKKFISRFKLKENAKILKIIEENDLKNLPVLLNANKDEKAFDYEKISEIYDVIYYNPLDKSAMSQLLPCWDCECIYVMNPSAIVKINEDNSI